MSMSYPFSLLHLSHISPKKDFSGREIAIYNTWLYREGILEYYSYMQTHGGEHFVYEMVFPPFGTGISVGVTDMPLAKFYGCLTFIPFSVKASITSARFSADQPLYWFKHGPTGAKAPLRANVRRSLLPFPCWKTSMVSYVYVFFFSLPGHK